MTTLTQNISAPASANISPGSAEIAEPGHGIRLVLVDDDEDYREAVSGQLSDFGFEVAAFADGPAMFAHFAEGHSADVAVLDWRLPASSGLELLAQMRRRGIQIPVLFLTGLPATTYENAALEQGALDFVDKARGVEILAKRVRLIVEAGKRPAELSAEETIERGRLLLRPRVSRAYWDNVDVNLTVTEFNIVHLLAMQLGEYATYRAIYDCVHHAGFIAGSGEEGHRTNVRSAIKRIRNKFRALDNDFGEIENFPAFGYRWRALAAHPA
jgi:two-component system response regulator ChvI